MNRRISARSLSRGLIAVGLAVASTCHADDGPIDPAFGINGLARLQLDGVEGHELRAGAVLALPDGKLLFGGSRNRFEVPPTPDPRMRAALARMNADGSPDGGFGTDPANPGILVLPSIGGGGMQQIEALRRFENGVVVAAGSSFAFAPSTGFVAMFDARGGTIPLSTKYDRLTLPQTQLHAVAIDTQGRIVVGGEKSVGGVYQGFLARIDRDGSLDTSFGANHDGTISLVSPFPDGHCYVRAIALDVSDRLVAGGSCGDVAGTTQFSVARFDAAGLPDWTFAGSGWRLFRMPGDTSVSNQIEQMLSTADGGLVLAAYHDEGEMSGNGLVLKLRVDGAEDPTFGDAATPGYRVLPAVADAQRSHPSALLHLDDGRLLVGVSYVTAEGAIREHFATVRLQADGSPDERFGKNGLLELDPLPAGGNGDLTAMTLQGGKPILAGSINRDPASEMMDIAAVRLLDGDVPDDAIFADGFEMAAPSVSISTYDDLAEGFYEPPFHYNGITYRDINDIAGVFPTGETFTAEDVGTTVVVERAVPFFADYPDVGSAPNVLTFGPSYVNGDNFSIGPLARATMDLDVAAEAVRMTLVYYQNGPWGGIELHLDAYRDGTLVGSDQLRIDDGNPGRDDMTMATFEIAGVEFDQLKFYATYQGQPSAPRVMIDDLSLTHSSR